MYEVFTKLLNMSLTAGILVLIVIILRLVLKRAPKKYICILWALVAFRLILPFSISSSISAYNVLHQNTISGGQVEYFEYNGKTEKPQLTFEVPALVNDNYSPDSMTVGTKISGIYMPTVVKTWLAGVIVMFAYAIVSFCHLRKKVRASIKKDDNVFVCDEISSPFILGVIRPGIYLPSGLTGEVKENVVAHEQAHIKRLDYFWKPLGFVLLSIYWFNPLIWVAYIFLCKDIEAACDEKVISQMDKEHIAAYSKALLVCASQRRMITACPVAFGETDVKGRIKNVLNYKKPAFWIITVSVITCVIVGIFFLTNPKGGDNQLLDKASPETSAMSLHYFDGEKTEIKWLYDSKEEQKIIDAINNLFAVKCDSSRITDFTTPCYGLEISDKDGYMIWLTYCNGLWLNKDGSVYEAKYNFEKIYNDVHSDSVEIVSGGSGMTNAGLLGEYDVRYYSKASEMSSLKDGVKLSISAIDGNIVKVLLQNNSSDDFIYGTYYSLHKEIDGVWYILPNKLSNYGFTDIAMILANGESREEQCDLTMYGELQDGHYRIEKEGLVAEFSINGGKTIIYSESENTEKSESGEISDFSSVETELFKEMSGEYWLLSGTGGWQTRFYLYSDGYFVGLYEDGDAGSIRRCEFSGYFEYPVDLSENAYITHIGELVYEEPGEKTEEDGIIVTTSIPYGFAGASTTYIYAPNTPVSSLSNNEYFWLSAEREEFWDKGYERAKDDLLPCFAIRNIDADNLSEVDYMFTLVPERYQSDLGSKRNVGTGNNISYSEYTDELIFNFGGKFFLSEDYIGPRHGEGTPLGWFALGGEGKCLDPSCSTLETFADGKLIEYRWLDNHSDCQKIVSFSAGNFSCCLYQYSFDLFTVPELEQYPDADPTSEYWVIFYTEGEGKPLYIKYFNCDYFTQEQAMETISPGLAIVEND